MITRAAVEKQRTNDALTKSVLAEYADDETQVHAVEHHFVADASASLEALSVVGRELGFKPSPIRESERGGRPYFFFDLVSKTPTLLPTLSRESILMMALGEAFSAKYDGWGTGIVKGATSAAKSAAKKKKAKATPKVAKKTKKKSVSRKR